MTHVSESTILTLRDISVVRGRVTTLKNVSLDIRRGEHTCIVGPNGAGKSTLLSVMSGVLAPSAGALRVDRVAGGVDLTTMAPQERARFVSVLRQVEQGDLDFSVRDVVTFGRFPYRSGHNADAEGDEIVERAMRDANVAAFRERPVRTLSGGEQRRVHLARVLAQSARLVLLDEPTASLDLREQRSIEEIVRRATERGIAAVTVTHDVAGAMATADRLLVLKEGGLVYDGPTDSVDARVLEGAFGVPFVEASMAGRRVLTESRV